MKKVGTIFAVCTAMLVLTGCGAALEEAEKDELVESIVELYEETGTMGLSKEAWIDFSIEGVKEGAEEEGETRSDEYWRDIEQRLRKAMK